MSLNICRGINISKIKQFESLLSQCQILLIQETWALKDQVGRLNQYFPDYNTYGISSINDNILLAGRPHGGLSFIFKKSLSSNIKWLEMNNNIVCCIWINTDVGE